MTPRRRGAGLLALGILMFLDSQAMTLARVWHGGHALIVWLGVVLLILATLASVAVVRLIRTNVRDESIHGPKS